MTAKDAELWDDLARHCGVDPEDRERREKLKQRAYEIILGIGLDGRWRRDDARIQEFLEVHGLRIMRILLKTRGKLPD